MTISFFRKGNGYEFVKDGKVYDLTAEMMACFDRQYRQMGYIVTDIRVAVSYTKVADDTETFLKKVSKKG